MITVSSCDLPGSYVEASRVSRDAQKKYIKLVRFDLILISLGSLLSTGGIGWPERLARIGAASMLLSAIVTFVVWKTHWARTWFDARAVAESVKTLSWQYMTGADAFSKALTAREADERFVDAVNDVLSVRKDVVERMVRPSESLDITPKTREVRDLPSDARRDTYLEYRVKDQREWYGQKTADNRAAKERFYAVITLLQALAFGTAVTYLVLPGTRINPTGFLATVATASLTWLQTRRHEELSQSYSLAAQELKSAETLARYADSDQTLSNLVCEVERAISREHTLCVARRTCSESLETRLSGRN